MSPRARLTAVAFAALTLACGDIAAPARNDFYEWRLEAPSATGAGTDTISFHWPARAAARCGSGWKTPTRSPPT